MSAFGRGCCSALQGIGLDNRSAILGMSTGNSEFVISYFTYYLVAIIIACVDLSISYPGFGRGWTYSNNLQRFAFSCNFEKPPKEHRLIIQECRLILSGAFIASL